MTLKGRVQEDTGDRSATTWTRVLTVDFKGGGWPVDWNRRLQGRGAEPKGWKRRETVGGPEMDDGHTRHGGEDRVLGGGTTRVWEWSGSEQRTDPLR